MTLYEKGLIRRKTNAVKILGDGELTKKLTITADKISQSAQKKIEKAKGTFKELMPQPEKKAETIS